MRVGDLGLLHRGQYRSRSQRANSHTASSKGDPPVVPTVFQMQRQIRGLLVGSKIITGMSALRGVGEVV